MADSAHHPGVRSLLAKFETNQTPSPSDRGRSPLSRDTSVPNLSRVRASFVTVEGAIQSATPGSPLRKTSGRSEPDMFGPKINAPEPRLNVESPNLIKVENSERVDQVKDSEKGGVKEDPASSVEKVASKETTTSHTSPNTSAKRPAINSPKQTPSNKSSTMPAPATHPTAREIAKERANAPAHTTTRSSTHPSKPTTRAPRGSVSSQRSVPQTSPKAPTKPVRLPASMTASTRSSASKTGATAPPPTRATANISTKQSSVKSVPTRSASTRKQPRPSLPAHETVTTKPVNNSFLTRMMRPTASSASKTHDKTDNVPPPKTTTRAPRPIGKATERVNVQPKAKAAPLRSQTEKSQTPRKDLEQKADAADIAHKQESDKENVQVIVETSQEPDTEEPNETIAEPVLEIPVKSTEEAKDEPANVEPEPTFKPATEPESPAQPTTVDITPKEILTEETLIQEDNSVPVELLTNATYEAEESTVVSEDETKSTTEESSVPDAQVTEVKDVTSIDDVFGMLEEPEPSSKDESSGAATPETLKSPQAKVVENTTLPEASAEQPGKSTVDEIDIVSLALN